MTGRNIAVGAAAAVVIIGGGLAFHFFGSGQPQPAAVAAAPYVVPAFGDAQYKNEAYDFSLKLPEGFTAREIPPQNGTDAVVLEDGKGNGIQILVTPFGEDLANLDADRIHQDIPDLSISDPQPVEIGNNYTGLAFKSDNEAFDGASREVWFVFRSNLYQISTYDRLDPLLQAIFSTWQFF